MHARPNLSGEWWIADGQALYADGDIGDMTHEGYAIDYAKRLVLDALGLDTDDEYAELPEEYEGTWLDADNIAALLEAGGMSAQEARDTALAALDQTDSRNVALR